MPNAGYDNDRYDESHGTGRKQGDGGFLVERLCKPTSTGEQHARGGYMRSEAPWGSDGECLPVAEKFATGVTAPGYNTAAEQGLTGP